MNKFQPERDTEFSISRDVPFGVSGESVVYKAVGEADLADVNRRVTNRNGDGDVLDLARRIAQVYRRIVAPSSGVSTLTTAERRAMRDRIIAAMTEEQDSPFANDKGEPTPALVEIANLLSGLTDELTQPANNPAPAPLGKSFGTAEVVCPHCNRANTVQKSSSGVDRFGLQSIRCTHCSKNWSERLAGSLAKSAGSTALAELQVQVRGQIDELVKRIDGILQQRATAAKPTRFQTGGVAKGDVASQELAKALANGKPARWD